VEGRIGGEIPLVEADLDIKAGLLARAMIWRFLFVISESINPL
jgi:hypothetical protein